MGEWILYVLCFLIGMVLILLYIVVSKNRSIHGLEQRIKTLSSDHLDNLLTIKELTEKNYRIEKQKENEKQRIIEEMNTEALRSQEQAENEKQQILAEKDADARRFREQEQFFSKKEHEYHDFIRKFGENAEDFFVTRPDVVPRLSQLAVDYLTMVYDSAADYLDTKQHPAHTEAIRIRALKEETKQWIARCKETEYQLAYLKKLYPIIEEILDGDYTEARPDEPLENRTKIAQDPARKYLSDEEWRELSPTERNQRALENYVAGRKTNWEIGRDYEMYIGHCYLDAGCQVDFYGSNNGLEDLGRDLIVKVGSKTHIVQCKYWAQSKEIHENHIAQLYGSIVAYSMETSCPLEDVIGILVTNTTLSEMAKKFCDLLNIQYQENVKMGDFPRIKCNIGVDEYGCRTRIYHLPMDQQYDKVKIKTSEECYAYTVQEAEAKGFRRAYRWYGNG